ncbi:MAG: hydroxyacylglutathione hydrolase C-terminal domain-containing protein, partial [Cyanobacteria bacterium J06641_5]
ISIDPGNSDLQERFAAVEVARRALQPTVPSWLGVEKHTNPFLRWEAPALQQATRTNEPARTFARLRGMKDRF